MEEKTKPAKAKEAPKQPEQPRMRTQDVVRFIETNLDGTKFVRDAIRKIKGVSFTFGNAIAHVSGLGDKKFNQLSEQEMGRLEDMILHPEKHNIPVWLLDRRKDPRTGENRHLTASTWDFTVKIDINEMKRLKTYKGVRHSFGLPVRGQRTRSSFRSGKTVGVRKKDKGKGAPAPTAEKK